MAGITAHLGPTYRVDKERIGSCTVWRRIWDTGRLYLLSQKSSSDVDMYGSLNCGSSSAHNTARAEQAKPARMVSTIRYTRGQRKSEITIGWTFSLCVNKWNKVAKIKSLIEKHLNGKCLSDDFGSVF